MVYKRKSREKKKKREKVDEGMAHIHSTFNNTIITITKLNGEVLCWSAAQKVAEDVARKAQENFGLQRVIVVVKGPGAGRETAIRTLQASGLKVVAIREATPIPHNGCRPPKKRRV